MKAILIKSCKRIKEEHKKLLPDLFADSYDTLVYPLEHCLEFYDRDGLVGAMRIEYRDPKLSKKFKPVFSLWIYYFEIVPGKRRLGYGKKIIEYIKKSLPIYRIELTNWNENSMKFWWAQGFRKPDKHSNTLISIVKR